MASILQRKAGDGSVSYLVRVRLKGHPLQTATFKRKTDAKKWAQQTESAIREGRYFNKIEATRHTMAEAIDRYLEHVLSKKPKSARNQKTQLMWWRKEIGQSTLADVSPALLSEKRELLSTQPTRFDKYRSPATVNRYLAALSHVFTLATKEWQWIAVSPFQRVSKLKEPRGRVRFLDEGERSALLATCKDHNNPYLYLVVILALHTGMRRSEVLGLSWSNIDFLRRRIIVEQTKNDERRSQPLVGEALQLVHEHSKVRRLDTDLLFPSKTNPAKPMDIRKPWETCLKRAEIEDFHFHDLRHCTASYLAMSGSTLAEIAEVLGHKTLAMVKRYSHLSEKHTEGVVERMADKFLK